MHRIITIIYGLLALSYIATTLGTPYSWSFIHKALPILLLALVVWRHSRLARKWLLLGGILTSASGDMLLALPIQNSFVLGLASFALAHILYALFFLQWLNLKRITPLFICLFGGYLFAMMFLLVPAVGNLRVPVIAYFVVISAMVFTAMGAQTPTASVRLGALLFVASDSLLAVNAFIIPLPMQSVFVMGTYYAAQFFIALGCIQLAKDHEIT
ncbi:lysoplasmalogenase [Paraglaciecola sp. 20A4]|uniref:lysoplasmalogenase n=1 Tax=Paraglaciecola sp. 20A4 TaxID=2687288 RepID=UPI00140D76F0|nr:lysoplasmalogenase [Paraglaciecola sp. 20A4]